MTLPNDPVSLDYAPRPSLGRRRWVRRALLLLTTVVVTASLYRYGPAMWQRATVMYWQRQCMNFSPPAGTVVFDRRGAKLATAIPIPVGYFEKSRLRSLIRLRQGQTKEKETEFFPNCLDEFTSRMPPRERINEGCVLYCHERVDPAGNRRLVTVQYESTFTGDTLLSDLDSRVFVPREMFRDPEQPLLYNIRGCYFGPVSLPTPVQIYAGQTDPLDLSHFTIQYRWPDGVVGTIDGSLQSMDIVRLSIRPGPGDLESTRKRYLIPSTNP